MEPAQTGVWKYTLVKQSGNNSWAIKFAIDYHLAGSQDSLVQGFILGKNKENLQHSVLVLSSQI
jgi:hypothetical protein